MSDAYPIVFALAMLDGAIRDESCTYCDIVDNKESKQWLTTMNEEIEFLQNNQTWELVQLLEGTKWLVANRSSKGKRESLALNLQSSRQDW